MVKKNKNVDFNGEKTESVPINENMTTKVMYNSYYSKNKTKKSARLTPDQLQAKIDQPDWSKLESSFSNLSVIGMGGMGTVFSAKDSIFYRNVALKIMRTDLRLNNKNVDSFIREARITAQIDHPNIIPVYNLGIFKELGPYFSMKKIDGITLANVLRELETNNEEYEKKYSLRHRLEIFLSICNGVAFAHSKGVVHCDLKPGNIMLGNYGEVFIMDWGMAVYHSEKDKSLHNAKIDLREMVNAEKDKNPEFSNLVNGTPAFMAPEQIFGKNDSIDEQTDVYALGVILYTLLTCTQSPFPPKLPAKKIFDMALAGDFQPPRKRAGKRHISRELEIVCLKAMSPYKHERYENVMLLMEDIRKILDMHPIEVYNSPFLRFIKFCRRHPMIPMALTGALIILGVFYSYFMINRMLTADALSKVLSMNISENQRLYSKVRFNFEKKYTTIPYQGIELMFDEDNTFELKNIINELDMRCANAIETLLQLNEVASLKKHENIIQNTLDFCMNYSLLMHNTSNINRIQSINSGPVYEVYCKMCNEDPQLRRKAQLLSINTGILQFKTGNKDLQIYITSQIDQDIDINAEKKAGKTDQPSEMIVKKGSFELPLKAGEYSLLVSDNGKRNITIPVTVNPGDNIEFEFEFPAEIPPNCVYIHRGNYYSNIFNLFSYGKRIDIEGFFLLERELTIGEYLEFWLSVKDEKQRDLYNPRLAMIKDGAYSIKKLFTADGKISSPYGADMPLIGISIQGAEAYCDYMSKKLGMKCRLPYFSEMEKAARGTGRRLYVWGNKFHVDYALLANNPLIQKYPFGAPPKSFPHDYSLYGVYDLTGNVRELVSLRDNTDKYAVYGASYRNTSNYAKCGTLSRLGANRIDVGMRYVVELK